jgi:GH15 family glucan-1,4-alpha-glucosidase
MVTNHMEGLRERSEFWRGALFGMVTGIASLLSYQYLSGILREPRLISRALVSEEDQFESKEALAMFIATESLKAGVRTRYLTRDISKRILHSGYRNFRESWARDFGFASYGMLALKQYDVVRETLESFFWLQKKSGQLPVKLQSMKPVTRFLHSLFEREQPTHKILMPNYFSAHGSPSLDGQALLIISTLHYVSEAGDQDFLQNNWHALELALKWLKAYAESPDGLLLQGGFSDWTDSVARRGCVLYTNVLYWKVLLEMAHHAETLDRNGEAVQLIYYANSVAQKIQERFWREDLGYFVTSNSLGNLSSDGNLLAIAWGLASPEQTESILNIMDEAGMSEPVPTRVVHPSYPPELIAIENRIAGLPNYHTDSSWLWLGAWHLIALTLHNDHDRAKKLLEGLADVIVRDQQINEVHGRNGKPLSSFWYKSEAPLIWNAGMVVYACRMYEHRFPTGNNLLSMLGSLTE